MKADLRRAIQKPHWRYKLLWLGLSLVVTAVGYALSLSGSVQALALGRAGLLSAVVAAGVTGWYALLVQVGRGSRARCGLGNGKRADRADKFSVWVFSFVAVVPLSYLAALIFDTEPSGLFVPVCGVLAFFAAMRAMDITRESSYGWVMSKDAGNASGGSARARFNPIMSDSQRSAFEYEFYDDNLTTVLATLEDPAKRSEI
ncbi:hypothetical protein [Salinisphaera sp. T31B1]|uniref:hypothetical protein n=1 Tax=Salinisphaera sp. T31B1 TaxID=727963 RepID=UPI00333FCE15